MDGLNWDLLNDGLGNPKNAKSMVWSHRTPPVMSRGVRDKMETAAKAGFTHIQFTTPSDEECIMIDNIVRKWDAWRFAQLLNTHTSNPTAAPRPLRGAAPLRRTPPG